MRIIGRLPHRDMQITVFSNDGRFPVQFVQGALTQQYRFRHGPRLRNLADVDALIDDAFKAEVLATFRSMRATHERALAGHREAAPDDDLPNII